ncbi:hypothetical protein GCM10022281_05240 [Sphingomonas rosea]|uniref:Glycoside hydrolase family 5 domain-containing protein n=1 Tax=Sphingomonas rosea TaxID=335605 RepID=A0ABP7TPE2_9SPHN
MIGINISGAEFGGGIGGNNDSQYHWPTLSELQYYQARGVDLVRIPFSWERMQPNAWGALSTTELGLLKTLLSNAATLGMDVIIDLHNYGRYYGNAIGASNGPSAAQFADFWAKLASEVKGYSSLVGYDLMNEPHDMPTATAWKDAAQTAVNAIRTVDTVHNVYVEGNAWSGAHSWQQYNADFFINDPAGRLIYQAHQYFDRDSSGTYSGSYDQEGAYPTVGVDRLKPFVDWLNANGLKGMIGEFGAPSNDPRWLEVTKNAVAYMNANGLVGTAWGGGTWWPSSYSMFMGAPGQADSNYFTALKDYFTPYTWSWPTTSSPTPAPAPAPEPTPTPAPAPAPAPVPAPAPAAAPEPVYHNQVIGTGVAETLKGTAAIDVMEAKEGDDVLVGSPSGDVVDGGPGSDRADYSASPFAVDIDFKRWLQIGGDAEGDVLANIEHVTGSALHDRLLGDALVNNLSGGNGDDWLAGRGGADRLDGGNGVDTASYEDSSSAVDIDLQRPTQLSGDAQGDVLIGIEHVIGSAFKDSLRGGALADILRGGAGDDFLDGRGGADTLGGGEGVDTVSYANSSGAVRVNLYWASQQGGDAQGDVLVDVENIVGSRFADNITANGEANVLDGGSGNDWLTGGWGSDRLIGGMGRDVFVFDSIGNANGDRVVDFNGKEDRLDFSFIDARPGIAGDQDFVWLGAKAFTGNGGELHMTSDVANTYVEGDVNGDGVADFTVALTGLHNLNTSMFIL